MGNFVAPATDHLRIPPPAVGHGRWLRAFALCLAVLASGCSSPSAAPGTSTSTSQSSSTRPSSTSSTSETAQVESGYRAYYAALERLMASGKADPAAMASVAAPEQALEDAKAASGLFSSGQHMVGHVLITMRSVTIEGDRAHVSACIDGRGWVSVPLASTSPPPGDVGQASGGVNAELGRNDDGRWILVSQVVTDDPSC
jgi:hypothetical protein